MSTIVQPLVPHPAPAAPRGAALIPVSADPDLRALQEAARHKRHLVAGDGTRAVCVLCGAVITRLADGTLAGSALSRRCASMTSRNGARR